MTLEVMEFDEGKRQSIKGLAKFIELKLGDGKEYNLEELFLSIFKDPSFPNQPIVSENDRREEFKYALTYLDKDKFEINETTIKLKK